MHSCAGRLVDWLVAHQRLAVTEIQIVLGWGLDGAANIATTVWSSVRSPPCQMYY